jgi:hypothetical protein
LKELSFGQASLCAAKSEGSQEVLNLLKALNLDSAGQFVELEDFQCFNSFAGY